MDRGKPLPLHHTLEKGAGPFLPLATCAGLSSFKHYETQRGHKPWVQVLTLLMEKLRLRDEWDTLLLHSKSMAHVSLIPGRGEVR